MLRLFRPRSHRTTSQAAESRPRRRRPALEALEGRQLLSLGLNDLVGNAFTAGPQELPVTASAPDGRSVVAWVDRGTTTSSPRKIEFRLFNPNGTTSFLDTAVQASGANASDPAVAIDHNGNFIITWSQQDNILAQRFNAAGGAVGDVITVANTGLIESRPDVAMDADGDFVIVYERSDFAAPNERDVVGKLFSKTGAFLRTLDTQSGGDNVGFADLRPSVAMAADGRFAIAYEFFTNGNSANSDIVAFSYFANGDRNSLVNGGGVGINSSADEEDPDVAMRDNGEYTIVYTKNSGFLNGDIKAQRASFDNRLFGEINIANSSRNEVDPRIVMNRNGFGFVVAFDSFGSGSSQVGVVEVKGNNVVNFTTTVIGAINPALSLGPDGQYQLVFQRSVNGDNNVFRRRGDNLAN